MTGRDIFLAGGLCLSSLVAGVTALIFAEFGAPTWVFVGLLAWLLTAGLPTLTSVLLLARYWPGPSFGAFILSAIVLSFLAQLGAIAGIRWAMRRHRHLGR